jgi:hypothetical protein
MDGHRMLFDYLVWCALIVLVLILFSAISNKFRKLWELLLLVLVPTWFAISVVKGMQYLYFDNSTELFSFLGFIELLAETLPMTIIFGGITFWFSFRRIKSQNRSVNN